MDGFWQRLKQRKLFQWSVAYIAASFAFVQVLDVVAQRFAWPDPIEKLIILVLVLGFFVALVLAWYHGERGAQRVGGPELLIIALLLAIGGGALWAYARAPAKSKVDMAVAKPASPSSAVKPPGLPAAVTVKIPSKSVAVLPFANESGKQDEQYFSDGLSEDLINALSQFDGLRVISRNSAFQFRDSKDSSAKIGQLLGVAHLLEGSVQREGGEVRITAALVNARDGSTLWSQQYDKPYKDLFALQDAITKAVADALKAKLLTTDGAVVQSDRPPSGSLDAYAAYQHGMAYDRLDTEVGYRRAIDAFHRALRLDPHYAAAYARLSFAWSNLASTGAVTLAQALTEAGGAADTALRLAPTLALAHRARALASLDSMDWTRAAAEAQRALQLAPNEAAVQFTVGNTLAMLGQLQQAVVFTRQALTDDPRRADWHRWLSVYLSAQGQLDAAQRAVDIAIGQQPSSLYNHEQVAVIEILRGQAALALAAAQKEPSGVWRDIGVTLALQIGPDRAAANAALNKLIAHYAKDSPYQIAGVYALRRDPDRMFDWLNRAWLERDPGVGYVLFDPFILRYRGDPRFAAFCKKVGLPATTDAVAMR